MTMMSELAIWLRAVSASSPQQYKQGLNVLALWLEEELCASICVTLEPRRHDGRAATTATFKISREDTVSELRFEPPLDMSLRPRTPLKSNADSLTISPDSKTLSIGLDRAATLTWEWLQRSMEELLQNMIKTNEALASRQSFLAVMVAGGRNLNVPPLWESTVRQLSLQTTRQQLLLSSIAELIRESSHTGAKQNQSLLSSLLQPSTSNGDHSQSKASESSCPTEPR